MVDGTVLQLEEAIAQPSDRHIVVIAESPAGEPLGFAYAALKPDYFTRELHGYLEEIVALRDGEGIGAALLAAVEAWAFGKGSRYVELSVLDRNANAIAFYERSGYAIDVRKMVKLRPGTQTSATHDRRAGRGVRRLRRSRRKRRGCLAAGQQIVEARGDNRRERGREAADDERRDQVDQRDVRHD